MSGLPVSLPSLDATMALGARLASALGPGDVVFLIGALGAGKTSLARGAVTALTGETDVASPTYGLAHVYGADGFEVWHCDLYRLTDPSECRELGLEEAFETAVVLVEWPDRLGALAPGDRLEVALDQRADGESRCARLTGHGAWTRRLHELSLDDPL